MKIKKTVEKKSVKPVAAKKKSPVKRAAAKSRSAPKEKAEHWNLRLYVAGQTPKSLTAFANLKRLCEEYLSGRYEIEIVDLAKYPHLAQNDQIVALPTLVRKLPEPIKRLIGDLSNAEKVIVGMDLRTKK